MSRILFDKTPLLNTSIGFIDVTIERYDSQKENDRQHWDQHYRLAATERMSVLNILHQIYEEQDPSLAFRIQQCNQGICNVCRMQVNGKSARACHTMVEPGEHIRVSCNKTEINIRDLVIE